MPLLPEVAALLNILLAGTRETLGENLVGVYLRGSLAMGGFDPATSDVNFFAITERPISAEVVACLAHASRGAPDSALECSRADPQRLIHAG